MNVGFEHRNENVKFAPDSIEQTGQLAGFGGAAVPINNSLAVDEEFIELRAPLVQDKPFSKDLVFGSGFRHSNTRSLDRKSTRLNSSHQIISYAVFCLKK